MVKVVWTQLALEQLERAVKFIQSEQGTFYANIVSTKVLESARNLAEFPEMGQVEPLLKHKKSKYRYLVVWSYKISYRLGTNKVVVSRVFHTSQKPTKVFNR